MASTILAAVTIIYISILAAICLLIIKYTETPSKGLAYLLLVISFPVIGVIFYLSVGLNYRKRKLYQKKIEIDEHSFPELEQKLRLYADQLLEKNKHILGEYYPVFRASYIRQLVSDNNDAKLLINGEQKFPDVLASLKAAKHHIHIEYYIYEDDEIGNQVAEILMQKASEGVTVRFIYDDFGSSGIRKGLVRKLELAGVEAYPFFRINLIQFANKINYRNHRKIIIIDGELGYVGGINVSEKYVNSSTSKLYWRDTHLKLRGAAALNLQFVFLTDWNFCSGQNIGFSNAYFPLDTLQNNFGDKIVQIIPSGPDSDYPNTMYSLIQTILVAKRTLRITTPYFIPDKTFLDAVKIAALSGIKVYLLVPGISDSYIVNTTSQSYYEELMAAGVRIFRYQKGFVHAKTLVCDDVLSVVGTVNLDNRSFDLNFEINAAIYSAELAKQLSAQFDMDVKDANEIDLNEWKQRPIITKVIEKVLHLFSPLM
jgi:cardiolipin synthase